MHCKYKYTHIHTFIMYTRTRLKPSPGFFRPCIISLCNIIDMKVNKSLVQTAILSKDALLHKFQILNVQNLHRAL